jgi:hypothetical protein
MKTLDFEQAAELIVAMCTTHREVVGSREVVIGKLADDPVALAVDLVTGDAIQL